jgi:acetoacetyl-CoA synthetase
MSKRGEILWTPGPDELEYSRIAEYLRWLSTERNLHFTDYHALQRWSVDDLPAFWRTVWDYFSVIAQSEPVDILPNRIMPGARWFPGACLNYAEQALAGDPADVVLLGRSQTRSPTEITRLQLRQQVASVAGGLRRMGVSRGDTVAGYLPNIPEAVVAFLATASIGAIWACCAPELGTTSVLGRLRQVEPKVLISVDGYRYGNKEIDRTEEVAAITAGLPTLTATVAVRYLRNSSADTWSSLTSYPEDDAFESVPFDHPLWVLFSSGTTGLPKAIVHSHGGIVIEQFKSHALSRDLGPRDRYFVFCSTSWVMWNIVVSALLVGSAIVCFDGDPLFPDAMKLWRVAEETRTTVFGCGAPFLVQCQKLGMEPGRELDLSQLRGITSTGSPLPADGFRWVYEHVSDSVLLQSASGGTDVCSGFVAGSPLLPVRAGEIACRCLGVDAAALDAKANPVLNEPGELVISSPMPSMPLYFWGDPGGERYHDAYFAIYPGRWRHGDWITFNEDGGCVITGRSDGTLNRGGVRLGSSEFYTALDGIEVVADSLVVHIEDPSGGVGKLYLFVQLQVGAELNELLCQDIRTRLSRNLSPRHSPDEILQVPAIPYNLTGKKLEVPVKRILTGAQRIEVVSDGAVRDPTSLDVFEQLARALRAADRTESSGAR